MEGSKRFIFQFCKQLHTLTRSSPSDTFKNKIAELEKDRRRRNPKMNRLFVKVPESLAWLDTATLPLVATFVGIALVVKLVMMYDDAHSEERLERKIKNAPANQGKVRMVTREEWEEMKDLYPRTPYDSRIARPNARIRTGEPLHMEDVKDWSMDVLTDALTRAEECVKHGSN